MKYDIELDSPDDNTSHGMIIDLVGSENRVLDIGCSTGYLARLLSARRNTVCGVEIDPDAARIAAEHLEEVLVADLETVDLVGHFGPQSFDVLIFADVLEHLRNPVDVLQRSLPLLKPSGSVVISIPNISHSAVSLALLEGRFEYRDLGLLDSTHLRFFTRSTLMVMLASVGLRPVDVRRTRANTFETEIPVQPTAFPPEVLDLIESRADADTYQFVLRAVPNASVDPAQLAAELLAKDQELQVLREQMRQIRRAVGDHAPSPRIGILRGGYDDDCRPLSALRSSVISAEIRRRVPGISVTQLGSAPTSHVSWEGEPITGLLTREHGPGSIVENTDMILSTAEPDVDLDRMGLQPGVNVLEFGGPYWVLPDPDLGKLAVGVGGREWNSLPDPVLLGVRLLPASELEHRRRYLRATGGIAASGSYLVVYRSRSPDSGAPLDWAISEVADLWGCEIELISDEVISADGEYGAVFEPNMHPIDLMAVVAGADGVVTDSGALAALALGFGRPVLGIDGDDSFIALASWIGDPDIVGASPASLVATAALSKRRAADGQLGSALAAALDTVFDDLGYVIVSRGHQRIAASSAGMIAAMRMEIEGLQRANVALQQRIHRERAQLGAHIRAVGSGSLRHPTRESMEGWSLGNLEQARAELNAAREQVSRLDSELTAVYQTKTMRTLAPMRRLYGRFRRPS